MTKSILVFIVQCFVVLAVARIDRAAAQEASPQPSKAPASKAPASKASGSKVPASSGPASKTQSPPKSSSSKPAAKVGTTPGKAPARTTAPSKAGASNAEPKSSGPSKAGTAPKSKKPVAPADATAEPKSTAKSPAPAKAKADPKMSDQPKTDDGDVNANKSDAPAEDSKQSGTNSNLPEESDNVSEADTAPQLTHDEALRLYHERHAAWEETTLLVESKAAEARLAKGDQLERALNVLVATSRESCERLTSAVIPALLLYETDFEDPALTEFLVQAVNVYSRRGRLEEAVEISRRLVLHDNPDPQVNMTAGIGALEDLNIDEAKKYLERAKAVGPLPDPVEAMLKSFDTNRDIFDREREVRAREAAANDLPRILFVTTRGQIEVELYEDDYPNAVASMLHLVQRQFYNGLPFYKVMPGFGAIAGCLYDDGTGGPGYEIALTPNPEYPRLPMRGAISLINMGEGACGSKFLISYAACTSTHLRRTQPVIGRVVRGMAVASELNWIDPRQRIQFEYDHILETRILRARPHKYSVVTTAMLAADKYNRGIALLNSGKFSEAESPLFEALKIAPRDRQILDAMALAVCQQERLDEGAKYLQRAVDADPHSASAHHHLGKVLAAAEKRDDARKSLEEAVKLKPDYLEARIDLAELLHKDGNIDAALAQYTECLKYQPNGELVQQRIRELTANKQ